MSYSTPYNSYSKTVFQKSIWKRSHIVACFLTIISVKHNPTIFHTAHIACFVICSASILLSRYRVATHFYFFINKNSKERFFTSGHLTECGRAL